MSVDLSKLSSSLFWDVDRESVDWVRHKVWILRRVLERGTWTDWLLTSGALSDEEIEACVAESDLQPRERAFVETWRHRHDAG